MMLLLLLLLLLLLGGGGEADARRYLSLHLAQRPMQTEDNLDAGAMLLPRPVLLACHSKAWRSSGDQVAISWARAQRVTGQAAEMASRLMIRWRPNGHQRR